ncbi:FAD-binding protein [bacterium]|nr:FAD-binding protein [bacterium]
MATTLSRRAFVSGVALAGAAGALTATNALASDAAASKASDVAWDDEYDVVVLGSGFSGISAATTAADNGAKVLITEKCKDGVAGGNSRVCAQLVLYGNGDVDASRAYLKALANSRTIPDDVLDTYAKCVATSLDTIRDTFGMNGDDFIDVADMGYGCMSPEYPEFEGSEKVHLYATHDGAFDSYLYQNMRSRLEDSYADKVTVWFESPATKLIQDHDTKQILGVQIDKQGKTVNVKATRGVVVCCGGFEGNAEMVKDYLDLTDYIACGSTFNTGDGQRMCQEVGADLWHMHSWCGLGGLGGISLIVGEGVPAQRINDFNTGAMNSGACILVGKEGKRYVNESETTRHGKVSNGNGQWLNPEFPEGVYIVYDKTQMDAVTASGELPDGFQDQIVECATIADAAKVIGCEADALQETIDDFNDFAKNGKDYEEGRDPETMRAFDGKAYYLLPVKPALLNTQGGPRRGADGAVIDLNGDPIPHLFSAGECGGVTAFMYPGGLNVCECFMMGQIAGASAAKQK